MTLAVAFLACVVCFVLGFIAGVWAIGSTRVEDSEDRWSDGYSAGRRSLLEHLDAVQAENDRLAQAVNAARLGGGDSNVVYLSEVRP